MPRSFSEWNEKHRAAESAEFPEPASIVRELLPLLRQGDALDVACGSGRNAVFLARQGFRVTAIDGSAVALGRVERFALADGVASRRVRPYEAARSARPGITLVEADLDTAELPARSYDLVICTNYLQRSLFPQFEEALRPGAMLLMETYTEAQLQFRGGPRNPDYLLSPGELRSAFPLLRTIFFRELRAGQGIASLLAQKPS